MQGIKNQCIYITSGPGSPSGKALAYGLDSPGSISGGGGMEIFLHSFMSTQPSIKMSMGGLFPGVKSAERRTNRPTSS